MKLNFIDPQREAVSSQQQVMKYVVTFENGV